MLIFIWSNGAFWYFQMAYPYLEVSEQQYASRAELASRFMNNYIHIGLFAYGVLGFCMSVGIIQLGFFS